MGVKGRAQLEKSKTRLCLNIPGRGASGSGASAANAPGSRSSRGYRVSDVLPSEPAARPSPLDNRASDVPSAVPSAMPSAMPSAATAAPPAAPKPASPLIPKPIPRSGGAVTVGEIRRSIHLAQSPVSAPRSTPSQPSQPSQSTQSTQPTQPTVTQKPASPARVAPTQVRASLTAQPRLSSVTASPNQAMQPTGGSNVPSNQNEFATVLKRLDAIEDRLTQLSAAFDRMSRCSSSSHESGRELDEVRKSLEVIKKRLGC